MTRKHFRAIAHLLEKHAVPRHVCEDFAVFCATQNEHFKRETFIKACGLE